MLMVDTCTASLMESVTDLMSNSPQTGFDAALARIGHYFQADLVSLIKIGSVEGSYSVIAQWPDSFAAEDASQTLNPWRYNALLVGQTVRMENVVGGGNPSAKPLRGSGNSELASGVIRIPIYHSGKVAYCLGLDWIGRPIKADIQSQLLILEPAARLIQSVLQSRQITDILRTHSRTDKLTGLVNRSVVIDYLSKAMARSRRNREIVAVLHVNIDRFKTINDALGYLNGDYLLKAVAKRFMDMFRETDTVARIGSDSFVIVLENILTNDSVTQAHQRIATEFEAPLYIGGQNLHIHLSQGVAVFDGDANETAEGLLQNSEIAMKHAKDNGGNQTRHFTPSMNKSAKRRLGLGHDLHRAINRGEFEVHYQPQMHLGTGNIMGAEALIRWPHPKLGMLPPSEFLWIAEETGLIIPLSEWILEEVCSSIQDRYRRDGSLFQVAINVSPRWFTYSRFPEAVQNALDQYAFPPQCLEFEITEDVVLSNTETTGPLLAHLKDLGVKITLDDFGTGYSSLSYLQNIPANALKIDRSFVSNLQTRKTDAAIVLALITLCKELQMEIVAEGVETKEQLEFLHRHGCDLAQGYFIGRPEPYAATETKLRCHFVGAC